MKLEWLFNILSQLENDEFYGKIVVNYCKGDVSVINKEESIHRPIKGKGDQNGRMEASEGV